MGDAFPIIVPVAATTFGASAAGPRTTAPNEKDPYRYQLGFGNYFSSEAV